MKKQIFIINGSGGVGKDTFIEFIDDCSNFPIMNFSSIDKVKEIARIIGWDGEKTERDRKFLSDLKSLCANYNDMPFNSMKEKVEEFLDGEAIMLFLHIREPEAIEKAKTAFNAKTILIKREFGIKQIISNDSDKNVFDYYYDVIVNNNNDLEYLSKLAIEFVDDFLSNSMKANY